MAIKWKPTPGKIVVEIQDQADRELASGIILLGKTADQINIGRVVATPEDAVVDGEEITPFMKVGAKVVFGKYTGTELSVDRAAKSKIVIMREVDILAEVVDLDAVVQEEVLPEESPVGGLNPDAAEVIQL